MQEHLYFSATANYEQKKTFILNHLGKRFGKEDIGLYRDDAWFGYYKK